MEAVPGKPVSKYLVRPRRSLQAVCRATGRNEEGRACPACPIRDLCQPDTQDARADVTA